MGGVQVCNEASKALLAHEQTRASVMSVQKDEGVGAEKKEREACCKAELSHKLEHQLPSGC